MLLRSMRVLHGTADLSPERFRRPVVTLGVFDGVHRGHRAVLARTREMAAREGGEVVVLTFDVHPHKLTVGRAPPLITSLPHRLALLAREGVDTTVVLRFDSSLRETTAQRFVEEVLLGRIGARGVVVGHDTHFGHDREGDHALLERILGPRGVPVLRTEAVTLDDGTVVSSSSIRAAVASGDLAAAARLLGRPPALFGVVVKGDGRGRTLGYPTANLDMQRELRPGRGVYAGHTTIDGVRYAAAINVGGRPTFFPEGEDADTVEVHVLDYDGDLYGLQLEVPLFGKLRDERKFDTPEALRAQIERDVADVTACMADDTWSSD